MTTIKDAEQFMDSYGLNSKDYNGYYSKGLKLNSEPTFYLDDEKSIAVSSKDLGEKLHFKYIKEPYYKYWMHLKEILFQTDLYLAECSDQKVYPASFKKNISKLSFIIKKGSPNLGYGLYAGSDLDEGTYIGEYVGYVRPKRLWNQQSEYLYRYPTRVLDAVKPMQIDAKKQGNYTRFINHSDSPNLDTFIVLDRQTLRVCFQANKSIKEGEQLFLNYGSEYWINRERVPEIV